MNTHDWFREEWERAKDSFWYKLESLELEVTEKILEIMEQKGMSRSELAQRLGVSKAAVSKLLNSGSNMTLKRLLSISEVLEHDLTVNLVPTGQQIRDEVVQYNPRSESKGFRFDMSDFNGADGYVTPLEGGLYAIDVC